MKITIELAEEILEQIELECLKNPSKSRKTITLEQLQEYNIVKKKHKLKLILQLQKLIPKEKEIKEKAKIIYNQLK